MLINGCKAATTMYKHLENIILFYANQRMFYHSLQSNSLLKPVILVPFIEEGIIASLDDSKPESFQNIVFRCFSNNDENAPYFPEDFEVAKYDILEQVRFFFPPLVQ